MKKLLLTIILTTQFIKSDYLYHEESEALINELVNEYSFEEGFVKEVLSSAKPLTTPYERGCYLLCILLFSKKLSGCRPNRVSLLAPWAADSSGITRRRISGTTGTGAAAEAAAPETPGWDYRVGTTNNRRGFGGSSTPSSAESHVDRRRWRQRFATRREQEHGTARPLASMIGVLPHTDIHPRRCTS